MADSGGSGGDQQEGEGDWVRKEVRERERKGEGKSWNERERYGKGTAFHVKKLFNEKKNSFLATTRREKREILGDQFPKILHH